MKQLPTRHYIIGEKLRVLAFLLLVVSAGCGINANNPAGFEYSGRGPSMILTDTLVVTGADTTWAVDLSLEASPRLFVGEYEGYSSAALLRFGGFPQEGQIQAARLVFHGIEADAAGDSTDTITLTLYRVSSTWDSSWSGDDLAGLNAVLGEMISQNSIPLSATADTLGFSIPAALVQTWAENVEAAALGVALVAESPAPFLYHLDSANATSSRAGLRPKLEFFYIHPEGGDLRNESLEPILDLSIIGFNGTPALDELWVGRGFPYRTMLTFDVSGIPEGITVNKATLKLGIRNDEGITKEVPIIAALPFDQAPWNLPVSETMISGSTSPGITVTLSDSTASLNVTRTVAAFFPRDLPQLGLMIVAVGEGSGIGMIRLWDSTAQSPDLAKLEIVYSLPPGMMP